MLTWFRAFVRSKYAVVLIVLLVLSFAVWGLNDVFTGNVSNNLATAGRNTLSPAEFERRVTSWIERVGRERGIDSREDAAEQGILRALGDQLVQQFGEVAYLNTNGVRASATGIGKFLQEVEAFHGADGKFDPEVYAQALSRQGYRPESFEADIRNDFTIEQFEAAIMAGLTVPRPYGETLARFATEQRTVRFVSLQTSDVPPVAEPSAEQLAALYTELGEAFAVPELRGVSVLALTAEDFSAGVEVDEAELRAAYDTQVAPLRSQARKLIREASFADEAAARAALSALEAGQPVSLTERQVSRVEIADVDFRAEVFEAADGARLVGNDGSTWKVIEVVGTDTSNIPRFEDLAPALREQAALTEANAAFTAAYESLNDLVGGGLSLTDIAKELGVGTIARYAPVDAQGRLATGVVVPELAQRADLLAEAFAGAAGEVIPPQDDPLTNGVTVIVTDRVIPARTRPQEELTDELRNIARSRGLRTALEALASNVGTSLADERTSLTLPRGRTVAVETATLTRQTPAPEAIGNQGALAVFAAQPNAVVNQPAPTGTFTVIRLLRVAEASPADRANALPQMLDQLREGLFADLRLAVGRDMFDAAKVKVNDVRYAAATSAREAEE
jgi:peptidyl-prolyl cis-trans isomerase D